MRVIYWMLALTLAAMPARAADLTTITLVQSSLSFNFVPLYIAQTEGYFADEGLKIDVVLAGGGPKAMTALHEMLKQSEKLMPRRKEDSV